MQRCASGRAQTRRRVRELEAELHVQLLARSARGMALTPAGRAFHTRAHAATTELRKAGEEAAQTGGSGAGTVTFSMGRVGVTAVLPEAVARFRRQFKNLSRDWTHQSGFVHSSTVRLQSAHVKDIPWAARAPLQTSAAPIGWIPEPCGSRAVLES